MKNKAVPALTVILIVTIGILAYLSHCARVTGVQDALFIMPLHPEIKYPDYEKIEDKNGSEYLVTYETNETRSIKVLNKNFDVIVKGTNYLYPHVLNTTVVSGAFFTQKDQKENKKTAVLNEKAAFDILGGTDIINTEINIDNEIFTIVGVANDKDDRNMNIYIPVYHTNQNPDAFAASLKGLVKTAEEEIKNKLKQFDINEKNYGFYNFNRLTNSIYVRFMLAAKIMLACILTVCIYKGFRHLAKRIAYLKNSGEQYDMDEVLKNNLRSIIYLALLSIFSAAMVVTLLMIFLSAVNDCLLLRDVHNLITNDYTTGFKSFFLNIIYTLKNDYSSGFSNVTHEFNKISTYSQFVFIAYLAFVIIFIFLLLSNKMRRKEN